MCNLSTSQVDRLGKRAFLSRSPTETKKVAASLARKLLQSGPRGKRATVIALIGDLGAGKTTFIQGFARGCGVKGNITSPTFVIFRNYLIPRYKLMVNSYKFFYHMDAYRITAPREAKPLGLREILHNPRHLVLVEWAEKLRSLLPRRTLWVTMEHRRTARERVITLPKKRKYAIAMEAERCQNPPE